MIDSKFHLPRFCKAERLLYGLLCCLHLNGCKCMSVCKHILPGWQTDKHTTSRQTVQSEQTISSEFLLLS